MPKVREVFAKAYGPVPERATCHVGYHYFTEQRINPTYCHNHNVYTVVGESLVWQGFHFDGESPLKGDISECDAAAFSPVFGCAAYDAALDALTKEEAEDSIHPDEIIKIANALAKFVLEGTGTQGVTVEDFAGYYLKASGAYERISADGTGESPALSTHLDVMGEGK